MYSPLLAYLTAAFELGAALWIFTRPGRTEVKWPVIALLFFLAGYQLIETLVCANTANMLWSRIAFVDIVWLPPLGIWIITELMGAGGRGRLLAKIPFVAGAILSVWALVDPTAVSGTVCDAVVASYSHSNTFMAAYGIFYQGGLLLMLVLGIIAVAKQRDPIDQAHLIDVTVGTLVFVFLTAVVQRMYPDLNTATPSVMCHLAASLAIGLARIGFREARREVS